MEKDTEAHDDELGMLPDENAPKTGNGTTDVKANGQNDTTWSLLVEPVLVGSMVAIQLGYTSLQNFYLRTACSVDLGFPKNICFTEEFHTVETQSQAVVSGVNISRSFVGCLIATTVLLFVGPWSDCSGRRKPLIIMPLVGMCCMTTAILLMLTFPGASTIQVLYAVQIPMSLGGNFGLLLAASFSYIGDVCHATGRDVTRTMGSHRAAIQVANVLGTVSGPLLFHSLGFYGVFTIVLSLQLSSLIFVLVMVKDVNVNNDNKVSVFNWRLPINAVKCLVKPRDGNKRKIIFLMLIVALGDNIMLSAEVLLGYMFYRRKFKWNDVFYGTFLAYRNITSFLGTVIILTVLKRRLRLSDEAVGVVSCCSCIASGLGLIAAQHSYVVLALPIIGILSQGSQVVQRPILNKQIMSNEQGKIYSLMGALQSGVQTMSAPLYSFLYSRTVGTVPDAWIVPGICLAIVQSISYFWSISLGKRDEGASDKIVELKTKEELELLKKVPNTDAGNAGKEVKIDT